ncbi:hypothetical protein [Ignatzschineria cameli]|uniref:Uncharacterized protein n=1 Tax=Ignatzschineria cameli TaxID=2182793 RepID=A0A2U2AR98_9GAMM|nr:hypothetical protein [Ignatzschineria cameli]PWD86344.1 hypothetical protein DC077_06295 [Ignatzschineria cameli]PWD89818.1 hypothetical protein DC079_05635 [Ignatzschineria cameli]PWD91468.1 hypothetical protein DC081_05345 [Ignatzschineria cameli]PWD92506.1 hypothetical protein DC078_05630 [Ignatzschineria cameli]
MRKAAMMLCAVGSIATAAYATPFTWNSGFGQGYLEYSLENNDGAELFISCNVGAGEDYDHGVTIYFQGNQVPAYDDDGVLAPIELAIDGRSYSVPEETFSDKGAREWNQMTQALSQASFFELFWNGEYLGGFNPQNREISKNLTDCRAMRDQNSHDIETAIDTVNPTVAEQKRATNHLDSSALLAPNSTQLAAEYRVSRETLNSSITMILLTAPHSPVTIQGISLNQGNCPLFRTEKGAVVGHDYLPQPLKDLYGTKPNFPLIIKAGEPSYLLFKNCPEPKILELETDNGNELITF